MNLVRISFAFLLIALMTTGPLLAQGVTCDSVYRSVDEGPTFGQSLEAFPKHLQKTLVLKAECRSEESFVLTWTVDKEGNMIDIDAPAFGRICKEDVLRQIKNFPRWAPGKIKGKPVCVRMYMCIKFG